jgi:hypothetical protein
VNEDVWRLLDDLYDAVALGAGPTLAQAVDWTRDGRDLVAEAWARVADADLMVALLAALGHPGRDAAEEAVFRCDCACVGCVIARGDCPRQADAVRAAVPSLTLNEVLVGARRG